MKRVLSICLALMFVLMLVGPARAQFFPEPFQKGVPTWANPVPAPEPERTVIVENLEIKISAPEIVKSDPDLQLWMAPLTNPTPFQPMRGLIELPSTAIPHATPPIPVPVHETAPVDLTAPSVQYTPYTPYR